MIIIGKPCIEIVGETVFLKSHIVDEGQQIEDDLYYMTDVKYGEFLTDTVCDCFLVGLFQPAIKHGQSINIEGHISERLAYNLPTIKHILSLGSCRNDNISNITINYLGVNSERVNNSAYVGCGCSLGVDSFAAMKYHLSEACPQAHRITHLTYFNVGAMGYVDLEKAKESYEKDLKMVSKFAETINLPVVTIESNISKWHRDFDFDDSGHFRNLSAILSMQKFFRYYLYASSFPINSFHFDSKYMGYYESLLFPLLSTENTEIIIANPEMNRVAKTRYIMDDKLAQNYLYVCWKELIANRWPNSEIAKIKDLHLNCSRCDKCKRTLLAIDLMGKLPLYEGIFDIPYWNSVRDSYIAKVIDNKDDNTFYSELYDLMQEVGYHPSLSVERTLRKIRIQRTFLYRLVNKMKRTLKQ